MSWFDFGVVPPPPPKKTPRVRNARAAANLTAKASKESHSQWDDEVVTILEKIYKYSKQGNCFCLHQVSDTADAPLSFIKDELQDLGFRVEIYQLTLQISWGPA